MEPEPPAERIRRLNPDQLRRLREALGSRKRLGNDLVAESLVKLGVKRLYALSGFPIDGVLKATLRNGIEVFGTRTQFGATVMSGTDNFISGRLASAVCISAGPAVTNAATGIYNAHVNHRPLLVLGSRRGFPGEGGAFQSASFVDVMSSITKWSAEVRTGDEIRSVITEAGRLIMDGQPGPVYLELPEHVLEGESPANSVTPEPDDLKVPAAPAAVSLDIPIDLMAKAERPLLCLTENLRWGWDAQSLRSFVETHELPFITTPMGRGLLPDEHPLCFNSWRRRALQKTDLFVMLGGALDWRFRHGRDLAPGCRILQVGLEPDLLGLNFPTAWQACMVPMDFVKGLGQALPTQGSRMSGWRAVVEEFGEGGRWPNGGSCVSPPGFVDPGTFLAGLRERLPRDTIVIIDGSICLSLANHFLRANEPFSWFDPGLNGCIGAGIPQAIGAKLACPDRPVVAIVGDTGFGMSGSELETAARNGIAIKVIVFNNAGITGEHRDQRILDGPSERRISRFQAGLRHDKVAEGFGVDSASSNDANTALEIISSMLSTNAPGCLDLAIDPAYPAPDIW